MNATPFPFSREAGGWAATRTDGGGGIGASH
jgi:hypothetical protein